MIHLHDQYKDKVAFHSSRAAYIKDDNGNWLQVEGDEEGGFRLTFWPAKNTDSMAIRPVVANVVRLVPLKGSE